MQQDNVTGSKPFGLWSAVFLGIGSMVGAGIFIVIGEAGSIAGSLVTVSFLLGGVIALLCGYSLAKLAIRYPSRGGITEYLVQGYGEGLFSGTLGVLFYFAQLVTLAAVSKSFGTYAATYVHGGNSHFYTNVFSLGILGFFVIINLIGAGVVARAENAIVVVKLSILILFAGAALFFIHPANLAISDAPAAINIFYALGLTFFAYQGFSVITNSIEDMDNPRRTMMTSMIVAIVVVALLYIAVSVGVFGNLPLATIIRDKDFALAEASRPAFGLWGFKIMAATALLATASAINATLYAVTQISYTLAKDGELPKVYEYSVFNNTEGLIISAALVVPMLLFFDLSLIAAVAAIAVLLIQGFTHTGHFFRRAETGANAGWILTAVIGTFGAAGFASAYAIKSLPNILYALLGMFLLAFAFELILRLVSDRTIGRQIMSKLKTIEDDIASTL